MKHKSIFDTPLVLTILFFVFLATLVFSIRSIVIPLRKENIALKQAFVNFENPETEIINNGKIYKIVGKY